MKERIRSIDAMRGVAILAVLLIHTTTRTLEASGFNLTAFSWTLFLNQIARFAVPLFFILSGFVLELSHKEGTSYWSFIKKRFSKIFIPYMIWSLIYYLFVYNGNHDSLLKVILTGNASYQLYFIPALCIFYIIFPLLHKLYRYIASPIMLLLLVGSETWFLYSDYFVNKFEYPDPIRIVILAYFFFVIGMVAAVNREMIKTFVNRFKTILPVSMIIMGIYVFLEGKGRYFATGDYHTYYSQWRPSILIYTILIALTLYYIFEHTKLQNSFISRFSKHSFFVFLVHVTVLETVWNFIGKNFFDVVNGGFVGKIIIAPIFFGVVTLISFLLAKALHKVPKLSVLLG